MHFTGIVIGLISFLSIGVFHPIVIKTEYHFSKSCWPVFLLAGILLMVISVLVDQVILSSALAVFGMSSWWSILELFEQEKRVQRGWFPANPKRKK
ncbi:MAG: DUF4491 family protein [Clostridia bacterium]|nr:DUF4491 family protein [Clostridia bacterium]